MESEKLVKSATKKRIGYLLYEAGIITREQLQKAVEAHDAYRKKGDKILFGQILIEMGFASEEEVTRTVASQIGAEYVSLDADGIDRTATVLIDPESVRRYRSLPIKFENNRLVLAMYDPTDIMAIDDIRLITGYEIKPVLVSGSELRAAIDQYARVTSTLDDGEEEEEFPSAEDDDTSAVSIGKPAVQLSNLILNQAVRDKASDIHIEPQEKSLRIRFRIDGVLHEVMNPPFRLYASLVSRIKVIAGMDIANRRIPQDGRTTMRIDQKVIDFRVASLPAAFGEKITMRLLDRTSRLITLSEMGFPESHLKQFRNTINTPHGCVLVTGPTGSGKTTTLYAALSELNSIEKNIITVEDPIEYRLAGINQVQVNNQAGLSFATGLRSILRNDPDIIMIGEIRDHETARIAVESALTGHLVLSTLHTNDAAGAISRLTEMGVESYLTASSVIAVLAQRLIRLLCTNCCKEYTIGRDELIASAPEFPLEEGDSEITLFKPAGCLQCSNTGYRGRKGVYELLIVSDRVKELALQHSPAGEIAKAAIEEGMVTLLQDGYEKVKTGLTSLEEVLRVLS